MLFRSILFMTKNQIYFSDVIDDAETFSKLFCATNSKTVICDDIEKLNLYLKRYYQVAVPFTSYVKVLINKI